MTAPLFGTGETSTWRLVLAIVLLLLIWTAFGALVLRSDRSADEPDDQHTNPAEEDTAGPCRGSPGPGCSADRQDALEPDPHTTE